MRKVHRLVVCAALTSAVVAASGAASAVSTPESASARVAASASPAHWKPWLLASANQFRLGPPAAASSARTKAELKQLLRLQKKRTPAVLANIEKWCRQPAVVPWAQLELKMLQTYRPRVAPASRALALLGVAMYDAMIAADDSRIAYAKTSRPAPWLLDKRLKPSMKVAAGSTYAPLDAAVAGAAERVLAYLYPGEPVRTFTATANEAINARLYAGLNYRSDLQQARALGQKVATLVMARGETDNHTAAGFSEGPFTGEQFWVPTAPEYEGAIGAPVGKWKPWLISGPQQFANTIPPPAPYGSPAFMAQLKVVTDTASHLTGDQRQIGNFWDDGPGTLTPPGHWTDIALQLIKSYKASDQTAARVLAYQGVAVHDAVISWFWLKYHYWQVRPITAIWRLDANGTTLHTEAQCAATPSLCPNRNVWYSIITTPAFPSYPAGHPTLSGISAKLLTYFFPKAGQTVNQLAEQVALSRVYGGIHYPEDVEQALVLGRAIADVVLTRARSDGSG